MKGVCLKFYTYEFQKHGDILLYEWLLELAKMHEIDGGSAFRGIAGFGRHKIMHKEQFFELASNVPIEVQFIIEESRADRFLELLKKEKIDLLYTKSAIEYENLINK